MKKFIVFILSFSLLYVVVQVLSGWIITVLYVPEISSVDSNLDQRVRFGQTSIVPFLAALVAGAIAYFLSKKLFSNKSK